MTGRTDEVGAAGDVALSTLRNRCLVNTRRHVVGVGSPLDNPTEMLCPSLALFTY